MGMRQATAEVKGFSRGGLGGNQSVCQVHAIFEAALVEPERRVPNCTCSRDLPFTLFPILFNAEERWVSWPLLNT